MRRFSIKNKVYQDKIVGYLNYDEQKHEYEIEIPEDVKSVEAPMIMADFIERNQRKIGKEWSLRWVKQRVIPPERQNIGQILRKNGMESYDEFPLRARMNAIWLRYRGGEKFNDDRISWRIYAGCGARDQAEIMSR